MHRRPTLARGLFAAALLFAAVASPAAFADDAKVSHDRPRPSDPPGRHGLIVIGHRGASGYRPEHTLESYRLAIRQGADFIEPDLVATKDGVLVARHENEISGTTDVAAHPEFASRRATKTIDGVTLTGWFTEDFTLAELKTLRAKERIPAIRPDNTRFDGLYPIPTLAEVIALVKRESRNGRRIGIYPETKHPTYFAREGRRIDGKPIATSLGAKLVETLVAEGFTDPQRVYVQSFEIENLIELKKKLMPAAGIDLPLVQLYDDLQSAAPYDVAYHVAHGSNLPTLYGGLLQQVDGGLTASTRYGAFATEPVLAWMKANYASGIGPWKGSLLPRQALPAPVDANGDGKAELAGQGTGLVHPMLAFALKAGLQVHPYTLRAEETYLAQTPGGIAQSVVAEAVQLYGLGVQGFFIDQPDQGVLAREIFLEINRLRER
ncbi:glycerophosphodiester phosphodiesterase family protein [Lysobacter sp. LF1]|uniref:glycerophosphodiester phosphodiesterase n=1 Tax=Lysobacter stagni TaxID=3045172 RepID=A0ABT6XI19_9GAMM|nr:glycerophosphodiester phosphodiesterase family protein [Lysobacter sp. LF1]MDI9239723.1 glycerophosphodiester phosphodiesterase family protein [Lysobacter sp. LF1]